MYIYMNVMLHIIHIGDSNRSIPRQRRLHDQADRIRIKGSPGEQKGLENILATPDPYSSPFPPILPFSQ
jgi:hypothetical protein